MELYGPVKLRGALADGTGDPLLTKDASTNSVGTTTNAFGNLQDGYILVGNISNEPTAVAVSGDVTITNAGVTSIGSGVIVNADINASAAIAVSKLAAVTASRALVSDVSGFISASSVTATELGYIGGLTSSAQTQINSKQATITGAATTITSSDLTASRALVSGTTGKVEVSSVTSTALGYVANLTSDAQTQLNTKLAPTITGVATGDILYYNGTAWVNLPKGTDGQTLRSSSTTILWDTPTINGIPIGGTDGQALLKQSGTDFDANWETLSVSSISDLTATAAELNVLDGITATVTELNYTDGVTSNIQAQLNNKLANSLAQNAMFVGSSSNVPTQLPAGSDGQVLKIVSGVPQWETITGTGTVTSVDVSGGTTGLAFTGGPISTTGTITASGTLALSNGGTGATLTDPGADRIMFWDDSVGAVAWLTPASPLTVSGTSMSVQDASGTLPGVVSTGTQTFAGAKTFTGSVDLAGANSSMLKFSRAGVTGVYGFEQSANSLGWYDYTNAKYRVRVSGDNVLLNETSGSVGIGGTPTDKFEVWHSGSQLLGLTTDGRLYGKALHNNAGAVTGTTNQYICSGTYTPTLTNHTNVFTSGTLGTAWNYVRVGNVVHVSGAISVDPTATGSTIVKFTLPIPSTFVSSYQCSGCGATEISTVTTVSCSIEGDDVGFNNGQLQYYSPDSDARTFLITFQYLIV